uniref:Immunoglobulin V-set domain-containing protein n=1 Tax=Mastacembelus armatus TaxID=205130 RepID=A0A7N9AQA7_9TELE
EISNHFGSLLYVVFTVFTGSSAVTPVFVQKGKDITLDVMTDGFHEGDIVLWRFNTSSVIVRFLPGKEPSVSEVYTGRVEFPQKKYSVTLKNLKESDSGVYTGQLIGNEEQTVVSPVKLTVDSVSSSSDSCNLTVTCSTQDSDITSRVTCDTTTCHQEGGESSKVTTSGASLRLYPVHSTINCNHSNQVNWTNDTKETGQACLLPPDMSMFLYRGSGAIFMCYVVCPYFQKFPHVILLINRLCLQRSAVIHV